MTDKPTNLDNELRDIIWSIDANFDENRRGRDSDYYVQRIKAQIRLLLDEIIGRDENMHPKYLNKANTWSEVKARNVLRAEQRKRANRALGDI